MFIFELVCAIYCLVLAATVLPAKTSSQCSVCISNSLAYIQEPGQDALSQSAYFRHQNAKHWRLLSDVVIQHIVFCFFNNKMPPSNRADVHKLVKWIDKERERKDELPCCQLPRQLPTVASCKLSIPSNTVHHGVILSDGRQILLYLYIYHGTECLVYSCTMLFTGYIS